MKMRINFMKLIKYSILIIILIFIPIILFLIKVPNLPEHEWNFSISFSEYIMTIIILGIVFYFRKNIKGLKLNGINVFGADFKVPTEEEMQDMIQQGEIKINYPKDVLYSSIISFIRTEVDKFKYQITSFGKYTLVKDINFDEDYLKWSFAIMQGKKLFTIEITFNTYHKMGLSWCIYVNGSVCSQNNQLPTIEMMAPMFKAALDNLPAYEEMIKKCNNKK
jgi:hypothetical protein